MEKKLEIKAIIGLGNPGFKFSKTRHNIGFMILDELARQQNCQWQTKDLFDSTELSIDDKKVLLIKPLTFMNASGRVIPFLQKKGIKSENILVVHDELEMPLGKLKLKFGGSAKGHNGLRSIIDSIGKDFWRLSFGIGRPEKREDVSNYVLSNFSESDLTLNSAINQAVKTILEDKKLYSNH